VTLAEPCGVRQMASKLLDAAALTGRIGGGLPQRDPPVSRAHHPAQVRR